MPLQKRLERSRSDGSAVWHLVKSDDVSWMPGTHMVEEETWLSQVVP